MLQRLAFELLHHDEGLALVFADIVNGANIRMVQSGGGLGLALEPFERHVVGGEFFGKKFQGHEAVQVGVFGLIDDTHPSPAELLDHSIAGDHAPNDGWGFRHAARC